MEMPLRGKTYKRATTGRPPIVEFLKQAAKIRRVVLIPEWNTSATHSVCGGNIVHTRQWRCQRNYSEVAPKRWNSKEEVAGARTPTSSTGSRAIGRVVSSKMRMSLEEDRFGRKRAVITNTRPSTASHHLSRTGADQEVSGAESRPPRYAQHSLPTAFGSIRRVCLEMARQNGVEIDEGSVVSAHVETLKENNGVSFCPHCHRSVHRDSNACCNIMKAFLYSLCTHKRPVHLRTKKQRQKVLSNPPTDTGSGGNSSCNT